MSHRNRVPISHESNFSHKSLSYRCHQRHVLNFSKEPGTLRIFSVAGPKEEEKAVSLMHIFII